MSRHIKFFKSLTERGQLLYIDRTNSFKKFPGDPKFIRCTFVPGQGWDMTENEAKQFIYLMDGRITDITYQPALDVVGYESDYIWIGFI
jgi:hypothetical protein